MAQGLQNAISDIRMTSPVANWLSEHKSSSLLFCVRSAGRDRGAGFLKEYTLRRTLELSMLCET